MKPEPRINLTGAGRTPALNQKPKQQEKTEKPEQSTDKQQFRERAADQSEVEKEKLKRSREMVRHFTEDAQGAEDNSSPPPAQPPQEPPPTPQEVNSAVEPEEPYRRVSRADPNDQSSTIQLSELFGPGPEPDSPPAAPPQETAAEEPAAHRHRHSARRERTMPDNPAPDSDGKLQFREPDQSAAQTGKTGPAQPVERKADFTRLISDKTQLDSRREEAEAEKTPKSRQRKIQKQFRETTITESSEQKLQFRESEKSEPKTDTPEQLSVQEPDKPNPSVESELALRPDLSGPKSEVHSPSISRQKEAQGRGMAKLHEPGPLLSPDAPSRDSGVQPPSPTSRQKMAQKKRAVQQRQTTTDDKLHFKQSEQSASQPDLSAPPLIHSIGMAASPTERGTPPYSEGFEPDSVAQTREPEKSPKANDEKISEAKSSRRKTEHALRFEDEDGSKRPRAASPKKPTAVKTETGIRFKQSGATDAASPTVDRSASKKGAGKGKQKSDSKLSFEDPGKRTRAARLKHEIAAAPVHGAANLFHQEISGYEDDNVGVESAHKLEEAAEEGLRLTESATRSGKLRSSREAAKEAKGKKLRQQRLAREDFAETASKNTAHMRQKQHLKKQYAEIWRSEKKAIQTSAAAKSASRAAKNTKNTAKNTAKATEKGAEAATAAAKFVSDHKVGVAIVLGLALVVVFLLNCFSSCSVLVEGGVSLLGNSTFANADPDMLGAEAAYAGMEADLQSYLDTYEDTHDYDEYHYDLDSIGHDPYVLVSLISALHPGQWTLPDVEDTLQALFDQQYILTETVTSETRYDDDDEPYTYYICTVKLENTDLSRLTATLLDEDGLHLYAAYMATRGNRPDLFPTSQYPNASTQQDYLHYDVPPEALEDETFAAMLEEAEKYLGFPYVWGGASPSTSFDCSGYVSWVINHSGWNVGRLTAQGLFNICTPVTAANARPGDLVLFKGTYNTTEVSHVGIYVGNHMMIHCGSPISYADLNQNYWQQHLFCYGRLP